MLSALNCQSKLLNYGIVRPWFISKLSSERRKKLYIINYVNRRPRFQIL